MTASCIPSRSTHADPGEKLMMLLASTASRLTIWPTDEDCRAKMREEIEGQMGVVGAVLIALAIFFLVVMYFTWKAWGMLSAQEDEEGFYEGGDQEGGDSLLDYAED